MYCWIMLLCFLGYSFHAILSLLQLGFYLCTQFLEFQLHESLLVQFVFIELNFDDFFLQFWCIKLHFKCYRAVVFKNKFTEKLSKSVKDVFWSLEAEGEIFLLFDVLSINVKLKVFRGSFVSEFDQKRILSFDVLKLEFDIEGSLFCLETALAFLQFIADHF